jgi:DNA-binding CsgD family transcriptional regulator
MIERRPRSDAYQYKIAEVVYDFFSNPNYFNNDQGLYPAQTAQAVLELQDKAMDRLWAAVYPKLTDNQRAVAELAREGLTQWEMANRLNCNQSSINKYLKGNTNYGKGKSRGTRYGGMQIKVQRIALADEEFRKIVQELAELDEGNRVIALVRSWLHGEATAWYRWIESPMRTDGISHSAVQAVYNDLDGRPGVKSDRKTMHELKDRYKLTLNQCRKLYSEWRSQKKYEINLVSVGTGSQ